MKLTLIPQPQRWTSTGGNYCGLFACASYAFPVPDGRLLRKAHSIFSVLEAIPAQESACPSLYHVWCGDAVLAVGPPPVSPDSYRLHITPTSLDLQATHPQGLFYGLVTLLQLKQNYATYIPCGRIEDWPSIPLRCGYLDFRFLFSKKELLLTYIEEMADHKINGLVIEYENCRPFYRYPFLQDPVHSFSKTELDTMLQTANENFIEIIPKQQCFGHLEYVLQHPQFASLREISEQVGELCPQRPGSFEVVCNLIDELAELHPTSQYLHLGCDEVWSLGACECCKNSRKSRVRLFIDFVNRLAEHVCALGKQPLIWHDMLASAAPAELELLDQRIIVCVWLYSGSNCISEANQIINRLHHAGLTVFGAPSVRCWDNDGLQNYPVATSRIQNLKDWAYISCSQSLPALIHTNWSVPFSYGGPYGLFETSFYCAILAAELSWNVTADVDSYFSRFLLQYHGISDAPSVRADAYYEFAPELFPRAIRHKEILQLLSLLNEYELYTKRKFPIQTFMYRARWNQTTAFQLCLKQKAEFMQRGLLKLRPLLLTALQEFLPDDMAEEYLRAKYYLPSLYLKEAGMEVKGL